MEDVKSLQEGTITPRPGTSLVNLVAFDSQNGGNGNGNGFAAATESETEQGCGTSAITVSSGAGVGLYGSYVTVIAATARISKYWAFTFIFTAGLPDLEVAASADISFDAGAGPEVNFIEGHTWQAAKNVSTPFSTGDCFEFPFEIPAGSRIRIRIKDTNAGVRLYQFTASMIG